MILKIFKPPADYKAPKKSKKIFLPEADGPDNQYIGMVLGPKGTTQKALEGKTGCKISVRGKGSSKQKRMEYDSDEKLHVLIQGDTDEQVNWKYNFKSLIQFFNRLKEELKKLKRFFVEMLSKLRRLKKPKTFNLSLSAVHWVMNSVTIVVNQVIEVGIVLTSKHFIKNKSSHLSRSSFIRAAIKCAICGDRSHPTSDCPQKKTQNTGLGIGFEFSQFMASLNCNHLLLFPFLNIFLANNKKPGSQMSSDTTGFITNNNKPVLALTFGAGGPMAYPQANTFNTFQNAPNPMMNANIYSQPAQPQRQQNQAVPNNMYGTQDASGQRPIAYSMSAGAGVPNFINPMMMGSYPQPTNQSSNISITTVNPNMPMGGVGMPMAQPGIGAFPGYGYNYANCKLIDFQLFPNYFLANAYQAFQMNNQATYQNYMMNNLNPNINQPK